MKVFSVSALSEIGIEQRRDEEFFFLRSFVHRRRRPFARFNSIIFFLMPSRSRVRWPQKRKPSSTIFDEDDTGEEAEAEEEEEFHRTPSNKRQRTLPRAIRDRINRALNQRLYLLTVDASLARSSLQRKYQVLGQTANVYTVEISRLPSCTCQ